MSEPKMENNPNPNPETCKDAQTAAVDEDGDVKMTKTELEKSQSPHPEDIQGQKEESSMSKNIKFETEISPDKKSEGCKEELPHSEDELAGVKVDSGDRCHNDDDSGLIEDKSHVEPPIVDGDIGITDAKDSVLNEKILEEKVDEEEMVDEDEKGEELDNGMIEMETSSPVHKGTKEEELENGSLQMDSSPNTDSKEEELNNGETELESANKTEEFNQGVTGMDILPYNEKLAKPELDLGHEIDVKPLSRTFLLDDGDVGDAAGTEEDQLEFMKELETFHKERCLEFKAPKFYGEPLNCLKLWRAVVKLGGYEQVTSCKLWRQVGESFKPPKTCTTVSWTFRCFYEKALLEYEKHKMRCGELPFTDVTSTEPPSAGNQACTNQASGSGRARRDAAARAMQGWHSQRLLGNGEVGDPIIKDKSSPSMPKREKQLKSIGLLKRKKTSPVERAVKVARMKASKPHVETMVVDLGPPADWVKINVQRTKDCFEVYALVPGLLREEVRVQSDPVGRLVISGQPEQLDNPWGVTPFKKVVSLPSRIDPHQTSAVVTLHGQLFVRVPFEQSDI